MWVLIWAGLLGVYAMYVYGRGTCRMCRYVYKCGYVCVHVCVCMHMQVYVYCTHNSFKCYRD